MPAEADDLMGPDSNPSRRWSRLPFAIHVGVAGPSVASLEAEVRRDGASVIELDLSGVRDRDALVARVAETFMFPHRVRGLDAVVDLVGDLEWFGNDNGYLVVLVEGDAATSVVTELAMCFPAILDRWREGVTPFVVVLRESPRTDEMVSAIAEENRRLADAVAWSRSRGPAVVLDHRG